MASDAASSSSERIFLDIRFGILKGDYLPGQVFDRAQVGEVYGCKPRVVGQVFAALMAEGYLSQLRPGAYAVRTWTVEEVDDLFDLRQSLEGLAAARAAERASDAEIEFLSSLVKMPEKGACSDAAAFERSMLENIAFHVEVIKMSRIGSLGDLARTVVPNVIHRRILWCHYETDEFESYRKHRSIVEAISERMANRARLAMRDDVDATREAVMKIVGELARKASHGEKVVIKTNFEPVKVRGKLIGLGGREMGSDGLVVPIASGMS